MPQTKIYTLNEFKTLSNHKHIYDWIVAMIKHLSVYSIITISAPVKCGKKFMAIIAHMLLMDKDKKKNIKSKSYFVTALHRKADEKQRAELRKYGLEVITTINKKETNKFIKKIKRDISKYDKIYIHLDENDYGAGYKQLLSQIWAIIQNNIKKFKTFTYSATGEQSFAEFCQNPNIQRYSIKMSYNPPLEYYGIGCYLRDSKFRRATDFFEYKRGKNEEEDQLVMTEQGENCILDLLEQTKQTHHKRHIGILRLTGNVTKKRGRKSETKFNFVKRFSEYLADSFTNSKCKLRILFVSTEDGAADWDEYNYWEDKESRIAYLIIVCEMAKRSTAWRCHPFLCWYHTHRPNSNLNTKCQDQERPVLYKQQKYLSDNGIPFHDIDIKIYGCIASAKYSAGWDGWQGSDGIEKLKNERINFSSNLKWNSRIFKTDYTFNYDKLKADSWEDIRSQLRSLQVIENKEETIRAFNNSRKQTYIKHKFSKKINYRGIEYKIANNIWDKYKKYKGFVITNIRSERRDWLMNAVNDIDTGPPIKCFDDIGIGALGNQKKFRIYVYYDKEETNPDNYKYAVTYIKSKTKIDRETKNTSMYNDWVYCENVEEEDSED